MKKQTIQVLTECAYKSVEAFATIACPGLAICKLKNKWWLIHIQSGLQADIVATKKLAEQMLLELSQETIDWTGDRDTVAAGGYHHVRAALNCAKHRAEYPLRQRTFA